MTTKRVTLAIIVSQFAALAAASAQPLPPPEDDEAAPGDLGDPATVPPDEGVVPPAEPEETVAEEVGEAEIDRGEKPTEVGYDKGFFIKSGDGKYSLKITARVQPFYTGTFVEGQSVSGAGADRHAVELRRGRLTLEGNAHTKSLLYKLQTDFGRGFLTLKDFHFDVKLGEDMWLRAGQWKRPFSRQQINSSGRLEITDRSITDRAFGAGRDIGIALRNDYEKSVPVEWTFGVFNGSGDAARFTPTFDDDDVINGGSFSNVPRKFRPAFIGRVGLNSDGMKGYSEADLEGGPMRWGAAASMWLEGDYDGGNNAQQKVELDYIVKVNGLSTTGGFYAMTSQTDAKVSDQELSHIGFHLQGGYMLTPKIQGAARFAMVDAQTDFEGGSVPDQQEISVGGNYYAFGHDAKLAGAVRFNKVGDGSFTDAVLVEIGANVGF